MEIEVVSPVHVGAGETLTRSDLAFRDGRGYVPDLDAYFRAHPKRLGEFVLAMDRGEPVESFFDDPRGYATYDLDLWADRDEIGYSEVSTAIKGPESDLYVPGSSIKGAIRTGLAYRALTAGGRGRDLESLDGRGVDDLFRLDRNDPKHDLLRCLTVRDTDETDVPPAVATVKTYSLSDYGSMRPKRWANYAEVIQPGTRFSTDLVVDADLLERMVDRFGEPWKARAVFGEDRSEAGIRDAIREALRSFRDAVVAEDRQLTGEFAAVESFYEGLDDDATHLRIGFGTGYHSNTVATALSAADRASVRLDNYLGKQMIHDGCGGDLTTDREEEGMLFCYECYSTLDPRSDEVRPPFPKTRRFVHRNGSPAEPLGWLQVEF